MPGGQQRLASIRLLSSDKSVYEPSDDSFALVDSLAAFLEESAFAPRLCIEIGTGSGYVICSVALLMKQKGICSHSIGVDLNCKACSCTQETLMNHKVNNVDLISCDLLRPLSQRLRGKVDLLIFNPPYVPTPDEEVELPGIARAWAGGMRGRAVIDRILPLVPELLTEDGHFFLVTVSENDPLGLCSEMAAMGLSGSVVLRRQADEETLSILHFVRSQEQTA